MKEVVGEIRRGQLVSLFGVGSLIDLPHISVIVQGLHKWSEGSCSPIVEPRLLSAVRSKLPEVQAVRSAPAKSSDEPEFCKRDLSGVPVSIFPRWLRCPMCNTIGTVSSGLFELEFPPYQIDKIKFVHKGCPKQGALAQRNLPGAVPVRFLVTCQNGHLSDFPWMDFCHRGQPCRKEPKNRKEGRVYKTGLVLSDEGVTGEAAEVQVRCLECDTFRPLADAFGNEADLCMPICPGRHPHLGTHSSCEAQPKAILLGASNLYFPLTVSVIGLPEGYQANDLHAIVKEHWDKLEEVASEEDALAFLKFSGISDFKEFSAKELVEAKSLVSAGEPVKRMAELRAEEYELLSTLSPSIESSRLTAHRQTDLGRDLGRCFDGITLVSRLTELNALVGFTRYEAAGDLSDYDSIDPAQLVPLASPKAKWVPGSENLGEGIFLEVSEELLSGWEGKPPTTDRMEQIQAAYAAFLKERPWIHLEMQEARYIALHTLSHMLLRELAISCGYSSTSLKERIYARSASDDLKPMAGILIYTASPDSEGTLGGLVSLGRPKQFEAILRSAIGRAKLCSSDPICAFREPEKESKIYGSACHSCSFISETSCEKGNLFLDRAMVVETLQDLGCGLFEGVFR